MNSNKIFVGNIMQHIYDNRAEKTMPISVVMKENAVLIRTKNGFYVDVEELYSLLHIGYLYFESYKFKFLDNEIINKIYMLMDMPTEICREQWMDSNPNGSSTYVDESSLKPYVEGEQNISISKLQRRLYSERNKRQ